MFDGARPTASSTTPAYMSIFTPEAIRKIQGLGERAAALRRLRLLSVMNMEISEEALYDGFLLVDAADFEVAETDQSTDWTRFLFVLKEVLLAAAAVEAQDMNHVLAVGVSDASAFTTVFSTMKAISRH